jgi:RNA polymerase sigma-70 factor, ECF subfamily
MFFDDRIKMKMEQETLILRLKRNDPGAFKELVDLYQNRIINTCYRFLFNREDAEDTAQEVFLDAYNAVASFKGDSTVSTWLYRIAVNRSIDSIRKKKRKKRFAPVKSLFVMEEKGEELRAPSSENPVLNLEQEERMRVLQEAIDTLPENQKVVFTLSKCDGVSNKEIARILEISLSSVESLMHRAKKNLRKKLFHYFERDLKRNPKLFLLFLIYFIVQRQFLMKFTSKF